MTPQDKEEIKQIIQDYFSTFIVSDRYVFSRHAQFLDGKNIQVARGTGTQIGTEALQKISLHGVTPVVQAAAISYPDIPGGTYVQGEAQAVRDALVDIIIVLHDKGIIA